MKPVDLPAFWRAKADEYERYSPPAAEAFRAAAEQLEAALRGWADETLNLEEAARESGYSADYLGELVRDGVIPNAGRKNAPRIRRADLPRKATARGRPKLTVASGGQKSASLDLITREAIRSKLRR